MALPLRWLWSRPAVRFSTVAVAFPALAFAGLCTITAFVPSPNWLLAAALVPAVAARLAGRSSGFVAAVLSAAFGLLATEGTAPRSLGLLVVGSTLALLAAPARRKHEVNDAAFEEAMLVVADGRVVSANPAACRLLGMPAEDLIGAPPPPPISVPAAGQPHEGYCSRTQRWIEASAQPGQRGTRVRLRDMTEPIREREAQRASRERIDRALEVGGIGTWEIELASQRVRCGPNTDRIFGFDPDGPARQANDFLLRVHPDDRGNVLRAAHAAFDAHAIEDLEFRVLRPDGSVDWLCACGRAVSNRDGGPPTLFLGTVRLTTEGKIAREETDRARLLLGQMAESSPDLMYVYDLLARRTIYANRAVERILGYTPEQASLLGSEFAPTVLHPEDAPLARDWGDRLGRTVEGEATETEYRIRHASGEWRWLAGRERVLARTPEGQPHLILGTARDVTEARQNRDALLASEERFRLAANAVNGVVYDWDLVSGTCRRSGGLKELLGYDPEEVPDGADWWGSLVHPDDRAAAHALGDDALAAGRPHDVEYRVRHKDGHWVHVWDRGQPILDALGRPVRLVGCTLDVSPLKRVQEALRQNETRLQVALQAADMGLWQVEIATGTLELSTTCCRLLGLDLQAANRRSEWEALLHPGDRARVLAEFEAALAGRADFSPDYRVVLADGGIRWLASRGLVMRDAAGRPTRILGVCQDVTARRAAEQAAREGKERLDLALEAAALGTWDWDLTSGRIVWSGHHGRLLGYPAEKTEAVYDDWARRVHPDDLPGVEAAIEHARAGGEFRQEFRVIWPDGSVHWILGNGSFRHDAGGRPVRMVGVVVEVTARRMLESQLRERAEQLAEADRRKDEFLAMLAHELRNPLAPIRNAAHVLRLSRDPASLDAARLTIERQVRQLARLVDDLLDVARIRQGKLSFLRAPADLTTAVRDAVEMSRPQADAGGHRLAVVVPEGPLWVDGDLARLTQVVSNLLNNAARYTEPGGRIALTAAAEGADAVVTVRDNGIGIPSELLPRLFDLFAQGDRPAERSRGGLGIGLTLVKRLVELHGGSVSAHSDGPGTGSTFAVRLPLRPPPFPSPVTTPAASTPPRPASLKVLVVDDNADAAASLGKLLELFGHQPTLAADGRAALEAARRERPDLVLCDIGLPDLDGYEVARRLRVAFEEGDRPRLVALTGYGQESDRHRAREAGFDDHLTKPVDPDAIAAVLAEDSGD